VEVIEWVSSGIVRRWHECYTHKSLKSPNKPLNKESQSHWAAEKNKRKWLSRLNDVERRLNIDVVFAFSRFRHFPNFWDVKLCRHPKGKVCWVTSGLVLRRAIILNIDDGHTLHIKTTLRSCLRLSGIFGFDHIIGNTCLHWITASK